MINIDRLAFGDHSLLDTAAASTGWFSRNEWFRLVYYAVTASNTAIRLPLERSCAAAGDCLSLTTSAGASNKTAILILAGRGINGVARPSPTPTDYLEAGNATGAYTQNKFSISTTAPDAQRFNDRLVGVVSN